MSCTGCATKFGLLKKEHGCSNCGFSYCGKCLSKQAIVAKVDAKKPVPVCNNCYTKLTVGGEPMQKMDQKMEAPIHVKLPTTLHYSQAERDHTIEERLQRLKQQHMTKQISQEEIEARLAKLKGGEEPVVSSLKPSQPIFIPADRRTAAEKTRDLLEQLNEEVELEKRLPDANRDLEERLAKLKGIETTKPNVDSKTTNPGDFKLNEGQESALDAEIDLTAAEKLIRQTAIQWEAEAKAELAEIEKDKAIKEKLAELAAGRKKNLPVDLENENSDEEMEKIVKKAVAENELEARLGESPPPPPVFPESEPELPWCCICTEDAVVRCLGCQDLYCMRCYREGHDKFDLKDHKTVPFKKRTSLSVPTD